MALGVGKIAAMEKEWVTQDSEKLPIDKNIMLKILKSQPKVVDADGTEFYCEWHASYLKYELLSEKQKQKISDFWEVVDKQIILNAATAQAKVTAYDPLNIFAAGQFLSRYSNL